ncbi:MAG: two-component system regulatory protein YycI [Clostridia bacterium]|nr:two-component system regulatory protein YycI [Clostridia bacterium]
MDWSKAKNILIILFLGLNIYLAVQIINFSDSDISNDVIKDTLTILDNRNIKLFKSCEIPRFNRAADKLNIEEYRFNKKYIAQELLNDHTLSDNDIAGDQIHKGEKYLVFKKKGVLEYKNQRPEGNLNLIGNGEIEKYAAGFLEKLDIPVSKYELDQFTSNNNGTFTLTFKEKYKGYYVFSNKMTLTLSKRGVHSLDVKFSRVIGFDNNKEKIVPAHMVLTRNLNDFIGKTILSIEMGYNYDDMEQEGNTLGERPVWRIKATQGEEYFYSADTGERIR